MYNKNGGEYYYIKESFNNSIAIITAYFIIISEILTLTSISIALGYYVSALIKLNPIIITILSILSFG